MYHRVRNGDLLPAAQVLALNDGKPTPISIRSLGRKRRIVIVGMPGAFTPYCARVHLPDLVRNYNRLSNSGIDGVYVVTTNDPFVLAAWSKGFGDACPIGFLSDVTQDFLARCGLLIQAHELFLGRVSARFAMIVSDNVVQQLSVEHSPIVTDCTKVEAILALDAAGPRAAA